MEKSIVEKCRCAPLARRDERAYRQRSSEFVMNAFAATSLRTLVCLVCVAFVGCGTSVVETDAGVGIDAGPAGLDGGGADAAIGVDASPGSDAGSLDAGIITADASVGDSGPSTPAGLLTRNHWEQVGFEDSGRPRMSTPGGNFFTFDGSRVYFGCDDPTGLPYTLFGGVITVELSSSRLNWRILELTDTLFSFEEGPDIFHFENRQECVMVPPDAGP